MGNSRVPDFLAGGGEMGALIRAHDWSATPLGPPGSWSQGLRAAIRLMLSTNHPIFIFWGEDLTCFYNDAYRSAIGSERHPSALGAPGRKVWAEIWDTIGPDIDHVMSGQGSTWHEDRLVPITRHGRLEEVYWTYSYSPVHDETSPTGVGGVLVICSDVTAQHRTTEHLKAERTRLHDLFEQAPGFIAATRGPDHVFELANDAYRQLVGQRELIGKTVRAALPELEGQGFFELLDEVHASGRPFVGHAMPIRLRREAEGPAELRYVTFVYQPVSGPDGTIKGLFIEGYDVTEQKLAEDRIRFQASLLDCVEQAVIATDLEGRITCWNRYAERLYGWQAGEVMGRRIIDVLPIPAGHSISDELLTRMRGSESWTGELVLQRRDGGAFIVHGIGSPIRDSLGQIVGRVGVSYDVSEARAAQDALLLSEERLRSALRASHSVAWELDVASMYVTRSSEAEAILGIGSGPASAYMDRVHEDDRSSFAQAFEEAAKVGGSFALEHRFRRDDGRVIWLRAVGEARLGADACPVSVMGLVQDITIHKTSELALEESEARFRDFTEIAADWFWEYDEHLQYTWLTGRRDGHKTEDVIGRTRWDIFARDPDAPSWQEHRRMLLARKPFHDFEHVAHRPNDPPVWVSTSGRPRFDAKGKFIGYRGVTKDITRRKHLEDQLRQAQKMEAVGQLTGGIAHDFNNLLTVILGNAEILAADVPDPFFRTLATDIEAAATRAAELTQRLLAFGRQQTLKPERLDLNEVLHSILGLLRRTLGAQIVVRTESVAGPLLMEVDRTMLESSIVNLAVNARDAMPDGGTLTITTAEHWTDLGHFARLTVCDTGVGMSKEVLARVFEPFFTTKEVGKGSGLGIPMVYGFVQQSGGSVEITSEVGLGTTVTLLLPRIPDVPEVSEPTETTAPAPAATRTTILVVEDQEDVRRYVTSQLTSLGYDVVEAADGRAALEKLKEHAGVSLLFTDVVLPGGLSGPAVAEEARKFRPSLPVLFTSGYAEETFARHGGLAADMQLLRKPYRRPDLAKAVQQALEYLG